jgi:predicted nucleic acid-binding protein
MQSEGLVDTNVFIHALRGDDRSHECREFLKLLRTGERRVRLEPYVVHELTFVIGRVLKHMTRDDAVAYIREVVDWPGIDCERELILGALIRWQRPGIAFADALLATQALLSDTVVFTVNAKHFADVGVAASLIPDSRDACP